MAMKKLLAMVFAGGLTLGLAAAGLSADEQAQQADGATVAAAKDEKAKPTTGPATTQASKTPINKMCPVMPEDEIDPELLINYKGKTIGVCCEDCIEDFNKDPEKWMKQVKEVKPKK